MTTGESGNGHGDGYTFPNTYTATDTPQGFLQAHLAAQQQQQQLQQQQHSDINDTTNKVLPSSSSTSLKTMQTSPSTLHFSSTMKRARTNPNSANTSSTSLFPSSQTSPMSPQQLRSVFRIAFNECSDRGLMIASKWAAEQLNSIVKTNSTSSQEQPPAAASTFPSTSTSLSASPTKIPAPSNDPSPHKRLKTTVTSSSVPSPSTLPLTTAAATTAAYSNKPSSLPIPSRQLSTSLSSSTTTPTINQQQQQYTTMNTQNETSFLTSPPMSEDESDLFALAKTYFACREFNRAAHVLTDCSHAKSVFLKLYAMFLVGDKRREEESPNVQATADYAKSSNKELQKIEQELRDLGIANKLDGFLLYLYGLVRRRQGDVHHAVDLLIKSVHMFPYNWSAWLELASCITENEMNQTVLPQLPDNVMTQFFRVHLSLENHFDNGTVETLTSHLMIQFPTSTFVHGQRAISLYQSGRFPEAEIILNDLAQKNIYMLDYMDILSNILYVLQKEEELSSLASRVMAIEKFRHETCCVLGNYYSLLGSHAKSILYFKRALKLNRHFLGAWTLIGHEYLTLKSPHAAIEAYRRAVDINYRDFRAWFGLGQAFEMLKLPFYSLYYFQRATAIRPTDARMWMALSDVYDKLGKVSECKKALVRVLLNDTAATSEEKLAFLKLGKLVLSEGASTSSDLDARRQQYHGFGNGENVDEVVGCFIGAVSPDETDTELTPLVVEACLYLAKYFNEVRNDKVTAFKYLNKISHRDDARAYLKMMQRNEHLSTIPGLPNKTLA